MDEKEANITRLEGLKEDFEQAMELGEYLEARACLRELEEMKVDIVNLENRVKEAEQEEKEFYEMDNEKWANHQRENQYYQSIRDMDNVW